jgi:hypothetical protein
VSSFATSLQFYDHDLQRQRSKKTSQQIPTGAFKMKNMPALKKLQPTSVKPTRGQSYDRE